MKRMKTFLIYALIIAAFWIFSDVMVKLLVRDENPKTNNVSQQVNVI